MKKRITYKWRIKCLYWEIEKFLHKHLKHRLKLCRGAEGICFHKGKRRRQNTAYFNDELNWTFLCDECMKQNNEYWNEVWSEYWSQVI